MDLFRKSVIYLLLVTLGIYTLGLVRSVSAQIKGPNSRLERILEKQMVSTAKISLPYVKAPLWGYIPLVYLVNNPERVEKLFDWKNYSRELRKTMINGPLEEFVQDSFKEGDYSGFLRHVKFSRLEELRKSYLDEKVSEAIKLSMELKFFSHAIKESDDGYRVHPYEKKNLNIGGLVIVPDDITTKKSYKELNESLNKASMKMYGDENWMNLGLTIKERVLIAYQATKDLLEYPYDDCQDYVLFKDFFGIMKSKDHDLRSHYPIAFFNEEGGIIEGKKNHVWPGIISIYKSGIEFYSTDPASDDYFKLNIADATIGSGHCIKVIYPGEYIEVYYYPGKEKN